MKNKRIRFRRFRLLSGLLSLGLVLSGSIGLKAEAAEDYTYQAVFHAGAQGTFRDTEQVVVTMGTSEGRTEKPKPVLSEDKKTITVEGLLAGDKVSFDVAQRGGTEEGEGAAEEGAADESTLAVRLENGSRYYVKGLRKSGRDGSDPLDATLPNTIDGDLDYVVAYGIQGDMTDYVVRYHDGAGRELRGPRRYTGNVGDRVVVPYLDIPGYQPQAYRLAKTLEKNEAENVLTFTYTPVTAGGTGGGGGGTTVIETVETVTIPGGAAPAAPGGAPGGAVAPGGPGGGEEIPEEEVPQAGPEELIDLDEEEVPLAAGEERNSEEPKDSESGKGTFYALAAVAVVGAGALAGILVWLWRRKRKKKAGGKKESS